MTHAAKLDLLRRWHAAYTKADRAWKSATPMFGGGKPDSPLWEAQWAVHDALTHATAVATGYDAATLDWWLYETEAGGKSMKAGVRGDMRTIKTLKDLQWLCELSTKKEEA